MEKTTLSLLESCLIPWILSESKLRKGSSVSYTTVGTITGETPDGFQKKMKTIITSLSLQKIS